MLFKDRVEAATLLARKLEKYKNSNGVIFAIPRGGVPIAYILSQELRLPLDILLSKKIGHPYNKEYAIGAVSMDDYIVDSNANVPHSYIVQEVESLREQLKEKYKKYVGFRQELDVSGKVVIITDDGIATGKTILLSIDLMRKRGASKVVIAVPVAPKSTTVMLSKIADEVVCLHTPSVFHGVGQFYEDFAQVNDEEVIALLKESEENKNTGLQKGIDL